MDAPRWQMLRTLFGEALELPPERRAAFVQEVRTRDAALGAELEALLAAADEASRFFHDLGEGLPEAAFSPERAGQVRRLFDELVDLDPEARSGRLAELGREAPEVKVEVEALVWAFFEQTGAGQGRHAPVAQDPYGLVGQTLLHYRILDWLGGGGMGVVYRAEDLRLHKAVALKFLPPVWSTDAGAKARFRREAHIASRLDHPNICMLHAIEETADGQLFLAMAYYEGETLKRRLAAGALPVEEAVEVAVQMAHGLARAHAQGVVHRDVKPANVMLTTPAPGWSRHHQVKLLDFGIARLTDATRLTRPGTVIGTVAYMSPEQARGTGVDHRTDLWSLGVVLYQMLAGVRPFRADYDQALVHAILHETPPPLAEARPEVPAALARVVERCLAKAPEDRYPTAEALAEDLRRLVPARSAAPLPPARRRRPARGLLLGGGVLASALLLVLLLAPLREAVWRLAGGDGLPAQKYMALLPAAAPTADSSEQVLAAGLTRMLTGRLEQVGQHEPSLLVEPAAEVRRAGVADVAAAHRRFGVNLVALVGAARNAGGTRVRLELRETATGRSLGTREVAYAPGPTAHRDLALTLADLLELELTPSTRRSLSAGGPAGPGAWHFYTQALGRLEQSSEVRSIEAAVRLFEQALETDPTFAAAHAGLGEAYWRMYEATRDVQWAGAAEQQLERALALDERGATPYVTLGLVHTGTGRYGTAIAAFRMALDRDSLRMAAHIGLARALEGAGRTDEAERAYRRAIRLRPGYWAAHRALGVYYYRQGQTEAALEPFRTVASLTPLSPRAYSNLGGIYNQLGRRQEARQTFEEGLRRAGPSYRLYANLATQLYQDGDYAGAARAYEAALALQEADYRVWGFLASARRWSGDAAGARTAHREAARRAEQVLALNPRDRDALGNLAAYYAYLGEAEQALAHIERLKAGAGDAPLDGLACSLIAEAYKQMGRRAEALHWVEETLKRGYALPYETSPVWQDLRDDPDFRRLLVRYGRATPG